MEPRVVLEDLASARRAAGISQARLGELMGGYSKDHMSRVERGAVAVTLPFVLKAIQVLNRPLTVRMGDQRFVVSPAGVVPPPTSDPDDALDAGTAKDEAACAAQAAVPQLHGHALAVRSAMRGRPEPLAAIIRHVRAVRSAFAAYERALARYPFAGAAFAAASALVEEAVADAA
ncbi:MAG: helix-turn-helix transcriptional regulator [Bacillota bacterium]|nr:helix-turn-helix transcriptional regulator [Bacillota bacterium]